MFLLFVFLFVALAVACWLWSRCVSWLFFFSCVFACLNVLLLVMSVCCCFAVFCLLCVLLPAACGLDSCSGCLFFWFCVC